MVRSAALLLCVLLVACAAGTPDEMRTRDAAKRVYVLDEGYQMVLKRLVRWDQECREPTLEIIGHNYDEVEHYPDLRQATIARGARGGGGQHVRELVDLREIGPGKTEMIVYVHSPLKAVADSKAERHVRVAMGDGRC